MNSCGGSTARAEFSRILGAGEEIGMFSCSSNTGGGLILVVSGYNHAQRVAHKHDLVKLTEVVYDEAFEDGCEQIQAIVRRSALL